MKAARFPACKDLSGFDFAASEISEALVRQLHRREFMDAAENVVLIHCPLSHILRMCCRAMGQGIAKQCLDSSFKCNTQRP